jgi:hypothetical protein
MLQALTLGLALLVPAASANTLTDADFKASMPSMRRQPPRCRL